MASFADNGVDWFVAQLVGDPVSFTGRLIWILSESKKRCVAFMHSPLDVESGRRIDSIDPSHVCGQAIIEIRYCIP